VQKFFAAKFLSQKDAGFSLSTTMNDDVEYELIVQQIPPSQRNHTYFISI
jgi:hypothetical protein